MNTKIIGVKGDRLLNKFINYPKNYEIERDGGRDLYNRSWEKSQRFVRVTNHAFGYMARDFRRNPIYAWRAILSPMTLLWLMMPFAIIITIETLT